MTKGKQRQEVSLLCYLQELVLELTHQVRTPLGVVANDLAYLQCAIGHSDLERPLRKTREISDQLSLLRDTLLLRTVDDLRSFCKLATSNHSSLSGDSLLSEALVRQLRYLRERFRDISTQYVIEESYFGISCSARCPLDARVYQSISQRYSSFYAWGRHGEDSRRFDLVLIDAAVLAHDGSVEVTHGVDDLTVLWWFHEI
jgi:signal transduction histidine kinase